MYHRFIFQQQRKWRMGHNVGEYPYDSSCFAPVIESPHRHHW
jgi:hypothetical protein